MPLPVLTPAELQKFLAVKDAFRSANLHLLNDIYGGTDDDFVARILMARDFELGPSSEFMREYHKWYTSEFVEDIEEEEFSEIQPHIYQTVFHGFDNEGFPVRYDRVGKFDPSVLAKEGATFDQIIRYRTAVMEHTRRLCHDAYGGRYSGVTMIIDTTGASFRRHANAMMMDFVRLITAHDALGFPNFLNKLYVINTDTLVRKIWNLVCSWGIVSERTKKKIFLCDRSTQLDVLSQQIPIESIPDWIGGKCRSCGPQGCPTTQRHGKGRGQGRPMLPVPSLFVDSAVGGRGKRDSSKRPVYRSKDIATLPAAITAARAWQERRRLPGHRQRSLSRGRQGPTVGAKKGSVLVLEAGGLRHGGRRPQAVTAGPGGAPQAQLNATGGDGGGGAGARDGDADTPSAPPSAQMSGVGRASGRSSSVARSTRGESRGRGVREDRDEDGDTEVQGSGGGGWGSSRGGGGGGGYGGGPDGGGSGTAAGGAPTRYVPPPPLRGGGPDGGEQFVWGPAGGPAGGAEGALLSPPHPSPSAIVSPPSHPSQRATRGPPPATHSGGQYVYGSSPRSTLVAPHLVPSHLDPSQGFSSCTSYGGGMGGSIAHAATMSSAEAGVLDSTAASHDESCEALPLSFLPRRVRALSLIIGAAVLATALAWALYLAGCAAWSVAVAALVAGGGALMASGQWALSLAHAVALSALSVPASVGLWVQGWAVSAKGSAAATATAAATAAAAAAATTASAAGAAAAESISGSALAVGATTTALSGLAQFFLGMAYTISGAVGGVGGSGVSAVGGSVGAVARAAVMAVMMAVAAVWAAVGVFGALLAATAGTLVAPQSPLRDMLGADSATAIAAVVAVALVAVALWRTSRPGAAPGTPPARHTSHSSRSSRRSSDPSQHAAGATWAALGYDPMTVGLPPPAYRGALGGLGAPAMWGGGRWGWAPMAAPFGYPHAAASPLAASTGTAAAAAAAFAQRAAPPPVGVGAYPWHPGGYPAAAYAGAVPAAYTQGGHTPASLEACRATAQPAACGTATDVCDGVFPPLPATATLPPAGYTSYTAKPSYGLPPPAYPSAPAPYGAHPGAAPVGHAHHLWRQVAVPCGTAGGGACPPGDPGLDTPPSRRRAL